MMLQAFEMKSWQKLAAAQTKLTCLPSIVHQVYEIHRFGAFFVPKIEPFWFWECGRMCRIHIKDYRGMSWTDVVKHLSHRRAVDLAGWQGRPQKQSRITLMTRKNAAYPMSSILAHFFVEFFCGQRSDKTLRLKSASDSGVPSHSRATHLGLFLLRFSFFFLFFLFFSTLVLSVFNRFHNYFHHSLCS